MQDQPLETQDFWGYLDRLIAESELVIDQPGGSRHPGIPDLIYPVDFGRLADSAASEGAGFDFWLGSSTDRRLDAVALTFTTHNNAPVIELLLGCTLAEQQNITGFLESASMPCLIVKRQSELNWLRTRRSVRQFQRRKIPENQLRQVLETAGWAPSSHNRQPWRFAVLQTEAAKRRLVERMGSDFKRDLLADGLLPKQVEQQVARSRERILGAPVAVVLCLDPSQGDQYPDPDRCQSEYIMGVQSVALAGCYLLLAAHALDLAGVWICAPLFAPSAVREALELPPAWQPQALVLLGYPAQLPEPRPRRPLEEVAIFL